METHSRSITKLILLTRKNLPQNSSHNLPTPRLRQIRNDENRLRGREGPDTLSDLQDEVFSQLVVDLVSVFDGDEGVDCLAGELVIDAHDGGFGDGLVLDERGFDFGGGEAVSGYVYDVVDAPADPVVAFVVTACSVAGEL